MSNSRIAAIRQLGPIPRLLLSPTVLATAAVAGAQLVDLGARIVSGRVITRQIGPELFGQLSTLIGIVGAAELLSRLGLLTASRLYIVQAEGAERKRQATGAIFVLTLLRGLVLALLLLVAGIAVDYVYGRTMSVTLWMMLPALVFLPCAQGMPYLAAGYGHTTLLVISRFLGSVSWLAVGVTIVHLGWARLTVLGLAQQAAAVTIIPVALLILRPTLACFAEHARGISRLQWSYGLHQYVSQLVDQGAEQLVAVVVPLLTSTREFGFLCLAGAIGMQTSLLSRSLCEARFRRIASEGRIPAKYVAANLGWLAVSAGVLLVIQRPFVLWILGPQFTEVTSLVPPLILAEAFRGAYQPYLAAVSGWADPRFKYTSFIAGPSGLVLYPLMTWVWGIQGAVWARVVMMALWYALIHGYYRFVPRPAPNARDAETLQ